MNKVAGALEKTRLHFLAIKYPLFHVCILLGNDVKLMVVKYQFSCIKVFSRVKPSKLFIPFVIWGQHATESFNV